MFWSKRLRHLWHEIYYFKASRRRVDFGLKCIDVTNAIDLRLPQDSWRVRFRHRLHLSFCQACVDYQKTSQTLRRALRLSPDTSKKIDMQKLNAELLRKHAMPAQNSTRRLGLDH